MSNLLDDYLELSDFARDEVKRHPRTVTRWTKEPDGLPYTTMGKTVLIHIPTAREWLFNRMRRPNPRRSGEQVV
jgi:hypothetical protein